VPTTTDRRTATTLRVSAVDGNAMLGRLTAVLGTHQVEHFSYDATPEGRADVVISVLGDAWQVDRVAARVRRLVGVVDVTVSTSAR
jgi:hypothetical protein